MGLYGISRNIVSRHIFSRHILSRHMVRARLKVCSYIFMPIQTITWYGDMLTSYWWKNVDVFMI